MRKGKRVRNYISRFLQVVFIAVIIYEISAPAIARPNQLRDFTANTTMVSQEAKRTEQVLTMENARIAFKKAMVAGGEKAAPYEYYIAQEYLTLAEEEFRSGDMGVSQFAAASHKYSSIAWSKAEGGLP